MNLKNKARQLAENIFTKILKIIFYTSSFVVTGIDLCIREVEMMP